MEEGFEPMEEKTMGPTADPEAIAYQFRTCFGTSSGKFVLEQLKREIGCRTPCIEELENRPIDPTSLAVRYGRSSVITLIEGWMKYDNRRTK